MKPISCELHCTSNVEHLSQLYTGFGRLKDRGLIDVNYLRSNEYKVNGKQLLFAVVDNDYTIAYDTADHDRIYDFALAKCDFYFKRSYLPVHHNKISSKILPLGLNYAVYGGNDGSLKRALWAFREDGTSSLKAKIRGLADSSRFLSQFASDKTSGRNLMGIEAFEGFPKRDKSPLVLFLARPWEAVADAGLRADRLAERHEINSMRATCVRELRKEFGPSFVGGFADSKFARENFPDCIVGNNLTVKSEYLRLVRSAGICIATIGLDRSNGWKLAEYVANAKAIVSETLHFGVTGNFEQGRNYLGFTSAEQCVESAVSLYQDPEKRYEMQISNYSYYHQYLRPDILVWNTLQTATSIS